MSPWIIMSWSSGIMTVHARFNLKHGTYHFFYGLKCSLYVCECVVSSICLPLIFICLLTNRQHALTFHSRARQSHSINYRRVNSLLYQRWKSRILEKKNNQPQQKYPLYTHITYSTWFKLATMPNRIESCESISVYTTVPISAVKRRHLNVERKFRMREKPKSKCFLTGTNIHITRNDWTELIFGQTCIDLCVHLLTIVFRLEWRKDKIAIW